MGWGSKDSSSWSTSSTNDWNSGSSSQGQKSELKWNSDGNKNLGWDKLSAFSSSRNGGLDHSQQMKLWNVQRLMTKPEMNT